MNCSHGTNPSSSSSPCWWLTGQLTGTNALAKTLECFLLLILVAMLEIKELGYHKPNTFSPFIFLFLSAVLSYVLSLATPGPLFRKLSFLFSS